MIYDLIIIGGGPAGVSAGVYAARKKLRTLLIVLEFGGQSVVSEGIENWIGTVKISGLDLAKNFKEHVMAYAGGTLDVKEGESVQNIKHLEARLPSVGFIVATDAGEYRSKTLLITTGSTRRKLEIPGAVEFDNKGLTYCASCDGPLFAEMDVAVIGGGNAGFETAAQLLAYAKSVVLLHRGDEFKADPVTVKAVLSNPKMHAILRVEILEVKGAEFIREIVYREKDSGNKVEMPVQGIFVEIGSLPATDFVSKLVERNQFSNIIVDPKNQRTSVEGIWAAGDCTDGLYHQNNIAAGDAVKALEDIYMYLHAR